MMNEATLFPEAEPQPPQQCKAVCFTGHRLEKLPSGSMRRVVLSMLYQEIQAAVEHGADTFYTGMASGVDMYAADYVLQQREQYPNLRLICVKPFAGCGRALRGDERYHFNSLLANADAIVELSDHYHNICYRLRNQYMIDHSDQLIAVVGEMRSGTGQTIRMAERRKLPVRMIDISCMEQHISDSPVVIELPPIPDQK